MDPALLIKLRVFVPQSRYYVIEIIAKACRTACSFNFVVWAERKVFEKILKKLNALVMSVQRLGFFPDAFYFFPDVVGRTPQVCSRFVVLWNRQP